MKAKIFWVLLLTPFLLAACAPEAAEVKQTDSGPFVFEEAEHDFGVIKQSGGIVSHDFKFSYQGSEPITITGTPGSCICTTGKVNITELQPGDSGILTVEFDPNLHEEPEGKFFKTVTLLTEPALEERVDVAVWVEIDLDLGPEAFKLQGPHADEAPHDEVPHDDEGKHENGRAYHDLDAEQLKAMLADKDFFLLDVHIPEQTHIPGTDAFVDYRKLAENADQLPEDKDTQIVVYCRSGGMSLQASSELSAMGYTEVYNLLGGINAFNAL